MDTKVLIFGANGQLGTLIKNTAPSSNSVLALSSAELDITDEESVARLIAETRPSVIINAAAYTQVDKAEENAEAAFAVNAAGPEFIARAAHANTRIIHISTDFVFSGMQNTPYLPEAVTAPLGVYGKSKLEGEQRLLKQKLENVTIIRTAWLYSAFGKNFVNTMLHLMKTREELAVVADQTGTPTSAHTLAEVVWKFVGKEAASGIYHWTDKGETTWYEFACTIQNIALKIGLLEKKINIKPITTDEYPTPASRPMFSVLDTSLTCATLGLEARDWQQELEEALLQIKK